MAGIRKAGQITVSVCALAATPLAFTAATANAADQQLLAAVARGVPLVEQAGARAQSSPSDPDLAQQQYDAARDLVESVRDAEPFSKGCSTLARLTRDFANAHVTQAEAFDLPRPSLRRLAQTRAVRKHDALMRAQAQCRPGRPQPKTDVAPLDRPLAGEAFHGLVEAPAPLDVTETEVLLSGRSIGTVRPENGRFRFFVRTEPGKYDIELRMRAAGRIIARAQAKAVWLLPLSGQTAKPATSVDLRLSSRLADVAGRFDGYAAIWVHNLTTGRTASYNADAPFPAASTVKLGVLVAGLARFGPRPEQSPAAHDLRAMTEWSSNIATNRLLRTLGQTEARGAAIAQQTLARLGATSSTFTGGYRAGTVNTALPGAPPAISGRVTTARDLGRILYLIHAAAEGETAGMQTTGLTQHEARIGLGWLLSSRPILDNRGLFRPAVPASVPLAQKHGWFSSVRHSAAIAYARDGPVIMVVLAYRERLGVADAIGLADPVTRLAVPR